MRFLKGPSILCVRWSSPAVGSSTKISGSIARIPRQWRPFPYLPTRKSSKGLRSNKFFRKCQQGLILFHALKAWFFFRETISKFCGPKATSFKKQSHQVLTFSKLKHQTDLFTNLFNVLADGIWSNGDMIDLYATLTSQQAIQESCRMVDFPLLACPIKAV